MIFFLLSKCLVWIPISLDRKILACPKLKIQFDNDLLVKNTWILSYSKENLPTWRLVGVFFLARIAKALTHNDWEIPAGFPVKFLNIFLPSS